MDRGLHGGDGKTYEKGIKNDCKGQIIHRRCIIDFSYRSWKYYQYPSPYTDSDDIGDLEPITPNHLLLGRPSSNFQPCVTNTEDIDLRKRWRVVQTATDMFWRRWLKEYVPLLIERKKWNFKNRNFQVGDLVLIAETGVPRSTLPLARIIEVKTSSDSTTRVAKVKSHHGVFVRPTTSLCLLEES